MADGLVWSSQYAASEVPGPGPTSRGDKIVLPQSALEGLLVASRSLQSAQPTTIRSRAWTTDPEWDAYGGMGFQQQEAQLPHPLTFRLHNPENGNTVWAGVREFSAEEGHVLLTPFLLKALGINQEDAGVTQAATGEDTTMGDNTENEPPKSGPYIRVQAQQLPKGKHVRLRPLEAGYIPDDWKPLLEREFGQRFTTLTKDTILAVQGPTGNEYRFLIDKVVPRSDDEGIGECSAVCVVDTDLEVDIEALDEAQARETVTQLMKARGAEGGEISTWAPVQAEVRAGGYVDFTLSSWLKGGALDIQLTGLEDDMVDLFVSPKSATQRALPRDLAHVFGVFGATQPGTKRLLIPATNIALQDCESIMISVYRYKLLESKDDDSVTRFTLRVKAVEADITPTATDGDSSATEQEHSPDEEQCKNCQQWIPKRTMMLHENFCRRNNIACPQCKRVFKKGSPEFEAHWHCPHDTAQGDTPQSRSKHDDIFHAPRTCLCGMTLPSLPALAAHRVTVCPEKLILCRFCHLEVPQEGDPSDPSSQAALKGMTEHEFREGGRTTNCHICKRTVRLFDLDAHISLHEQDKASLTAKPVLCSNINCGRVVNGPLTPDKVSSVGLASFSLTIPNLNACSSCSSPLHAQVYDPDSKALIRRIERRYLQQLMTGCGKSWCQNEWCRTGRANRGLEEKGKAMKDVMPLVKPLLAELKPGNGGNLGGHLYLCVDEQSTRYRAAAERLLDEGVWEWEWCVAGVESIGGDPDRARQWLKDYAPTKVMMTNHRA